MSQATPLELMTVAERLARSAAGLIRERQPVHVQVAATKSSPTDVVTQMDRDVESYLRARLAQERPADGFFGEEGNAHPGTSGLTWVVDPIDGTVNYVHGIDSYAVSVAVVEGGIDPQSWTVVAGAVHDVPHDRSWTAARGQGAWRAGGLVRIGPQRPLAQCLVGTGFGYAARRRAVQAQVLSVVLPHVADIRRIGAASLDLCRLAAGELDLVYERGMQPWDHAAGGLIVREAGGVVRGLRGRQADDRMLVAGPEATVGAMVHLLEEAEADRDQ